MLSIALPMHGVGHANYYVELAQKDYYTAQGNEAGQWFGQGAAKLGLSSEVDSRIFEHLLRGRSPDGRSDLVQNANNPHRQAAWDLTFSAPQELECVVGRWVWTTYANRPTRHRGTALIYSGGEDSKPSETLPTELQRLKGVTETLYRPSPRRVNEETKFTFQPLLLWMIAKRT